MLRHSCLAATLLLLTFAAGCEDDGTTTPTGTVVVIYQDTEYRGDDRPVMANLPDLDNVPGCGGSSSDWDDCISSIRVPAGWQVVLFENDNYAGASTTLTADTPDLERVPGPCGGDWDDCVSSIQVRTP